MKRADFACVTAAGRTGGTSCESNGARIGVTNADIAAAKNDWLAALDGDASASRVDGPQRGHGRLVQTHAQQITVELRAQNAQSLAASHHARHPRAGDGP